ncbi:K(+)/H(+) antiporter [Dimargaris verticillata]|uniref:K(+)/H(+) antiporter n=1 Tax=Dimargaris verticillata TaxID=2761393 RepID=A0A9W8B369_9FUNG|nr:K(+)/H(+) antiporter [Dimargaris verticillata]
MAAGTVNVFAGGSPIQFSPANPFPLFIIQLLLIICFCRLIGYGLSFLKQPLVIAEIIAGILLGPSAFGRIPHFTENIFPKESINFLSIVANLGLLLFLFIVGLELDLATFKSKLYKAFSISVAGMVFPFALGCAVSYAIYELLDVKDVSFGTFLLFMSVALAITAFPVLARILTELNLLQTWPGSMTISAAAVDDVTSWCLLALVLALINADSSLVVLWVILCTIGFSVFMVVVARPLLYKFLVYTNSFEHGPSQKMMFFILCIMFLSGWFTEIIGVHFIFGGFLAGVIVPHDHGFAIKIAEKIEDLVTVILLPIYFTLSGLKTNISTLDDGITWGMLFLVLAATCGGKILGCTFAARFCKFSWRESFTIGFLMNCKGLVELIVLNVGYDAGVIDTRIFTMMVIMALITTFMTTPIVQYIYPRKYYRYIHEDSYSKRSLHGKDDSESRSSVDLATGSSLTEIIYRPLDVLVCLSKAQHIPSLMTLMQFLRPTATLSGNSSEKALDNADTKAVTDHAEKADEPSTTGLAYLKTLRVHAVRLVALTQRDSAVMMSTEAERTMLLDPLIGMFRRFGQLNGIHIRSALQVCPTEGFASALTERAAVAHANYLIVPWSGSEDLSGESMTSPFDNLFQRNDPMPQGTSPQQLQFITDVFHHNQTNTVVYLDRGFEAAISAPVDPLAPVDLTTHSQHQLSIAAAARRNSPYLAQVFVPFFGGRDDRAAVNFALQFAANKQLQVVITRCIKVADPTDQDAALTTADFVEASNQMTVIRGQQLGSLHRQSLASEAATDITAAVAVPPPSNHASLMPHQSPTLQLQSHQEDEALFHMLFEGTSIAEEDLPEATKFTLARYPNVTVELVRTSTPLQTAIVKSRSLSINDLVVLGRGKREGPGHREEISVLLTNHSTHNGTGPGYQPVASGDDAVGASDAAASLPVLALHQNPKYRMLGDASERFLAANCQASLMVMQAKHLH